MRNVFLILLLSLTKLVLAQENLEFNKRFVQSEDKWVAFSADSIGSYPIGFIYIDSQAGLTFDYYGSFTIDNNNKYILKKKEANGAVKYRLQPNNNLIAFIPQSRFDQLGISRVPDWLINYKKDSETIERLYQWGYMYNGWGECEKALTFLEKAKTINPNFKGLSVELAFSYNCLKRYDDAITNLKKALDSNPLDAYTNKELIFAQAKNGQLEEAENTYRKAFKNCTDQTYNAENAYNILQGYYLKKDVAKFNIWLKDHKSVMSRNEHIKPLMEKMNIELNSR